MGREPIFVESGTAALGHLADRRPERKRKSDCLRDESVVNSFFRLRDGDRWRRDNPSFASFTRVRRLSSIAAETSAVSSDNSLSGITTPQLTTNCRASSTAISRSMASLLRTVIVNPVPGIGDVGISTLITGSWAASRMLNILSPVTKPNDQMPFRGYSTATTRVNSISLSLKKKSVTCLTDE